MRIYRRCGVADHNESVASAESGADAGMSLVEVLVAIAIITIGVLGLLRSLVTDARSQTLEKSQATAIHLATGALEAASYLPYASLPSAQGTATQPVNGINYTEQTTVSQGSGAAATTSVGIVVTWNAVGKSHSVTMQRNFANQATSSTGGSTSPLGSCGGNGLSVVTGSLSVSPSKVNVDGSGKTTSAVTVTLTQTGLSATSTSCIPLTWSDDNGAHQASMTPSGSTYSYTIPSGSITKASSSGGSVVFTATVPAIQVQPTATLQIVGKPSFGTCSVQAIGLSLNTITLVPLTRNSLLAAGLTCTTNNLSSTDTVTATYQTASTTKTITMTSTDGNTWTASIPAGTAMVKTGSIEGLTFNATRPSDSQTASQNLSVTLL